VDVLPGLMIPENFFHQFTLTLNRTVSIFNSIITNSKSLLRLIHIPVNIFEMLELKISNTSSSVVATMIGYIFYINLKSGIASRKFIRFLFNTKFSGPVKDFLSNQFLYLRLHQEPRKWGHQPSTKAAVV